MKIKRGCQCGSHKFKIMTMTITILNVPLTPDRKRKGEHTYDDTKGDSLAWDHLEENKVQCQKCNAMYFLEPEDNPHKPEEETAFELVPVKDIRHYQTHGQLPAGPSTSRA